MRVLVCGDRNWTNKKVIKNILQEMRPKIKLVIEGGAKGADTIGKECAIELNMDVREYTAEWQRFGRSAGPIRNREMLIDGKPSRVIAFHDDIDNSKGTRNMIKIAIKAGIPVDLYMSSGVGSLNVTI